MIDEKTSPAPPQTVSQPPPSYGQEFQGAGGYGPPQGYGTAPPPQPYPTQPGPFAYPTGHNPAYGPPVAGYGHTPQQGYNNPHAYGPGAYPQPGYPPQQQPPQALGAGAQYQQQLFAMCAAGHHDVQKKHGIAGIIGAIIFFPIGLLCLLVDVEKRCVRCGAQVG